MAEKAIKLKSLEKKSQILPKQEVSPQLHWFWRLTTKWWFFPLFYITLALILAVAVGNPLAILMIVIFMPLGLLVWPSIILGGSKGGSALGIMELIFVCLIMIIPYLLIVYAKYRLNKVLKWLIIILMLMMALSFLGWFWLLYSGILNSPPLHLNHY